MQNTSGTTKMLYIITAGIFTTIAVCLIAFFIWRNHKDNKNVSCDEPIKPEMTGNNELKNFNASANDNGAECLQLSKKPKEKEKFPIKTSELEEKENNDFLSLNKNDKYDENTSTDSEESIDQHNDEKLKNKRNLSENIFEKYPVNENIILDCSYIYFTIFIKEISSLLRNEVFQNEISENYMLNFNLSINKNLNNIDNDSLNKTVKEYLQEIQKNVIYFNNLFERKLEYKKTGIKAVSLPKSDQGFFPATIKKIKLLYKKQK